MGEISLKNRKILEKIKSMNKKSNSIPFLTELDILKFEWSFSCEKCGRRRLPEPWQKFICSTFSVNAESAFTQI